MALPVKLKDVVDAIEPLADEWHACINRDTGEIVSFTDEEAMMAEGEESEIPDLYADEAPKVREALSSEAWIELPGKFDFHEYSVMERFALSLGGPLDERLLEAMRGRGAFGRFRRIVEAEGIEDSWYAYRDKALEELAAEFLEVEGIPFVR